MRCLGLLKHQMVKQGRGWTCIPCGIHSVRAGCVAEELVLARAHELLEGGLQALPLGRVQGGRLGSHLLC